MNTKLYIETKIETLSVEIKMLIDINDIAYEAYDSTIEDPEDIDDVIAFKMNELNAYENMLKAEKKGIFWMEY